MISSDTPYKLAEIIRDTWPQLYRMPKIKYNKVSSKNNMGSNKKRVYITGTGRCGTTFIMLILTHLGLDVGFDVDNIDNHIVQPCNSGLEKYYNADSYIIKDMNVLHIPDEVVKLMKEYSIELEHIIIPVRNYDSAARSRVSLSGSAGGIWPQGRVKDFATQKEFFYEIMSEFIYTMTLYDIPTTFINFDKMIESPEYLYEKLQPVLLKNISFEKFEVSYNFASEHQKK